MFYHLQVVRKSRLDIDHRVVVVAVVVVVVVVAVVVVLKTNFSSPKNRQRLKRKKKNFLSLISRPNPNSKRNQENFES